MNRKLLLAAIGLFSASQLFAQTAGLNAVVQLNVVPAGDGTVTLKWAKATFTGSYKVFKNTSSDPLSFPSAIATLNSTDSTWKDASFTVGEKAEYAIARLNGSGQTVALGYAMAGNKTPETPSYGGIILLIDSNYILPLATELATLKNDLELGGWIVNIAYAGRGESVVTVKDRIKNLVGSAKPTPSYLYMIGHIPVPYSGYFSGNTDRCAYPPDGHIEGSGNHTGAWPADVYYGDLDGIWSDNSVNCTTGSLIRHHNIPGDGKFDECAPPSPVSLKIGRLDLFNMAFFNINDTFLTKRYLDRVHQWRIDNITYVERGLVDDNFTSLDLSATGYNIMASSVSLDSIFSNRDYFTAQNKENYLWSYGCGAGSYVNCSGIGGNNNFNPGVFNNIFTSLAGSFFGDWDAANCFLKAPLCSGSLLSFWGGIPKWYAHYFGLGQPMGYSTMVTQNATVQSFNLSQNKVHIALMGDPTLTLKSVPPAGKLTATSNGGHVRLNWFSAKGKFDGYCIYRIDTATNSWTRMNTDIITDTFYADLSTWASGSYKYAVRPIRLEKTGSGTYYNLGGGGMAWVNHVNAVQRFDNLEMQLKPNPNNGAFIVTMATDIPANTVFSISDISGRVFDHIQWQQTGIRSLQFDMGAASNGVYFLKITNETGAGVAKFQLQH
jgi:hypothetical protein